MIFNCFMHDYLFNQCVEHFSGQFGRLGILLYQSNPLFSVGSGLLFCRKFGLELFNFFNYSCCSA